MYPGPFGLVSDAHGNPLGLAACIESLRRRGAKTIFFLGDAVGYMPCVSDVLDLLALESLVCLRGNHEAMLLGDLPNLADDVYRLRAARQNLSDHAVDMISRWPEQLIVADARIPDRHALLVHGSPQESLKGYVYPDGDHAFADMMDVAVVACGHTHRAFVGVRRNGRHIVNCGSVGLPRDHGSLASCAFVDLFEEKYEILREKFDVDALLSLCAPHGGLHRDVIDVLNRP